MTPHLFLAAALSALAHAPGAHGWFGPQAVGFGAPAPPVMFGGKKVIDRGPDLASLPVAPPHPSKAAVIELLEDDAGRLARSLNPGQDLTNLGRAGAWGDDCFSGGCCLKVAGFQRFREYLPGWQYPVVEKPKEGQYRYVRFAWKKPEGAGVMVQVCAGGAHWGRYYAGQNAVGYYPSIAVAPQPPRDWEVVTRDLFADFGGQPFTLTGFAFTSMDGAALYDHIYLGRTVEDLDKVTAAARTWARKSEELDRARLGRYWTDLASEDAVVRQPAAWVLGACGRSSVPYLCDRVPVPDAKEAERKIRKAVADLDAPRYAVREKAAQELERFGLTALPHLEAALKPDVSPEWRERLEKLIARCKSEDVVLTAEAQRMMLRAIWVLEQADTPDARKRLGELAEANLEAGLSLEAKAALDRAAKRRK